MVPRLYFIKIFEMMRGLLHTSYSSYIHTGSIIRTPNAVKYFYSYFKNNLFMRYLNIQLLNIVWKQNQILR